MNNIVIDYLNSRKLKYKEFFDISGVSSFKIKSLARLFVVPHTLRELEDLIAFLELSEEKYEVVGRLTNTLIAAEMYDCVLVCTSGLTKAVQDGDCFTAECGCTLSALLSFAKERGYGGAEPLMLIPGSLGGAIAGNSGAHGMEIGDIFVSAEVFSPERCCRISLSRDDMCFSYRHTHLKDVRAYLLSATVRLSPKSAADINNDVAVFKARRAATQPVSAPSLGSIFKRYNGVSAGYYIDKAGLKGLKYGGASVSDIHAGFILNNGDATSRDVISLIQIVKERVLATFGVMLEEEIVILS